MPAVAIVRVKVFAELRLKVAAADWLAPIVRPQDDVPLLKHAPAQPTKVDPELGFTASVTVVPRV